MSTSGTQGNGWVVEEFAGLQLGDKRRSDRLRAIVEMMEKAPDASLPAMLGGGAMLEGGYRLFSNTAVEFLDILNSHIARSADRCLAAGEALVLHDTTDVSFDCYGDVRRSELSKVSERRQGFFVHASLAIAADGSRLPFGLLEARAYVHRGDVEDKQTMEWWAARDGILDNEQERWLQSIEQAETVAGDASLIHVCDREGDAYELLGSLTELGRRFVIRLEYDRTVADESREARRISEALDKAPWRPATTREVVISRRYGPRGNRKVSDGPSRRKAKLSFRTTTVDIRRPAKRTDLSYLPSTIRVNLVEVRELNPTHGGEPVHWILATTEPVEAKEEMLRVVDIYRCRWVVEEFFKAIKSGCAYEKRQLESARALLNMLAVTIPIAVHMLMLRDLAHEASDMDAHALFNRDQLTMMRMLTSSRIVPEVPTVSDALAAIAILGGHIKSNGPPGWCVLYRGYAQLLAAVRGYRAALHMIEEAQRCDQS